MALDDAGETDLALGKYFEALELDPSRSTTHYNVGLIYKYRNEWAESFRYNEQAVKLDSSDEAANWNLAIAATALRDWNSARRVWHRLGMPIEEGDTPIEQDFGVTPVRLNPDGDGEVVWGRRIDPVRVRILSIPFPDSGFHHGDVVLHDGAPVGYRESQGRRYSVFNALELFERSTFLTFESELHMANPEDMDALEAICNELDIACEDWTTSVRTICRQCSEGEPHEHHDAHQKEEGWKARHFVGLATANESSVREALRRWENDARKVASLDLVEAH